MKSSENAVCAVVNSNACNIFEKISNKVVNFILKKNKKQKKTIKIATIKTKTMTMKYGKKEKKIFIINKLNSFSIIIIFIGPLSLNVKLYLIIKKIIHFKLNFYFQKHIKRND